MPIEIRELVIRAVVEPPRAASDPEGDRSDQERAKLVQACVNEVMKALRRAGER